MKQNYFTMKTYTKMIIAYHLFPKPYPVLFSSTAFIAIDNAQNTKIYIPYNDSKDIKYMKNL